MPQVCKVITVERNDLPHGHSFVIVAPRDGGEAVVFAAPDARSQLDARVAFLVWERSRGTRPETGSLIRV